MSSFTLPIYDRYEKNSCVFSIGICLRRKKYRPRCPTRYGGHSLEAIFTDADALRCTHQAARSEGDKLLEASGCSGCSSETGGIGAAAVELLRMVDVRKDRGVSDSALKRLSAASVG